MATLLAGAVGAFVMTPAAYALPTNPTHEAAVTIANSNNNLNMNISSTVANNVIKWQEFSIARGETVAFDANNYLNQVTGSNMSEIWGTLKGGGTIYLINPNGILFGAGSQVNVGALYASTRTLSNADIENFKAGSAITALANDSLTGNIINMGDLTATKTITLEGQNIVFTSKADKSGIDGLPTATDASVKLVVAKNGTVQVGKVTGNDTDGYTLSETNHRSSVKGSTMTFNLVRNADELQGINNDAHANYMLAGTLDLNGATWGSLGDLTAEHSFYGNFDGLNYTINNLNISLSGEHGRVGLFGRLGNGSTVENVGRIGGTTIGRNWVGSIAGIVDSGATIKNVFNTGSVTGQADGDGGEGGRSGATGGIVGGLMWGSVENAYNTGAVDTKNRGGGGIVGAISGGYTLTNAYNTGSVTVHDNHDNYFTVNAAGGIIGFSEYGSVTVTNVYNAGAVTANGGNYSNNEYAGGIIGTNGSGVGSDNSSVAITKAYNKGMTTKTKAGTNGNAVSDSDDNITVNNSYYATGTGAAYSGATEDTTAVTDAINGIDWMNVSATTPELLPQSDPVTGVYKLYRPLMPSSAQDEPAPEPSPSPSPAPAPSPSPAPVPEQAPVSVTQTSTTTIGQLLPLMNIDGNALPEEAANISMKSLTEAENSVAPNVQTTNAPILATAVSDTPSGINGAAPEEAGNEDVGHNYLADGKLTIINKGVTPPAAMSKGEASVQQNGDQEAAESGNQE